VNFSGFIAEKYYSCLYIKHISLINSEL